MYVYTVHKIKKRKNDIKTTWTFRKIYRAICDSLSKFEGIIDIYRLRLDSVDTDF